jgi:hypothetical protein
MRKHANKIPNAEFLASYIALAISQHIRAYKLDPLPLPSPTRCIGRSIVENAYPAHKHPPSGSICHALYTSGIHVIQTDNPVAFPFSGYPESSLLPAGNLCSS